MTKDEFQKLKENSSARIIDKEKLDNLFSNQELQIENPRGFQLKSISDPELPKIYN